MRPLTAAELLNVWEASLNRSLVEKTLHLLAVACSVTDLDQIAGLSIGERDARLLQLREWMFGVRLLNMTACPECSQQVEWENEVDDMRIQPFSQEHVIKTFDLELDGFNITFRLPNSHDMTPANTNSVYRSDPEQLLYDCMLKVQYDQKDYKARDLPDHVIKALDQRMNEEDPQADMRMLLNCPACSYQWEARFDIAGYLWAEINQWAAHMLQEVCVLAKAFGWSERDIVNMSARRRQLYLELV